MSDSLIDQAIFDELKEATGEEFAAELVLTFLEEATQMLAELKGAIASGDADTTSCAQNQQFLTRFRVSGATLALPLRTRDTVAVDTPAALAMCRIPVTLSSALVIA